MGDIVIEMRWRCGACRAPNRGRDMACVRCGKPKGDEPYEMPAEAEREEVTDRRLLQLAGAGPNWRCAYCGSAARAASGACGQCGATPTSASPGSSAEPGDDLPPPTRRSAGSRSTGQPAGRSAPAVPARVAGRPVGGLGKPTTNPRARLPLIVVGSVLWLGLVFWVVLGPSFARRRPSPERNSSDLSSYERRRSLTPAVAAPAPREVVARVSGVSWTWDAVIERRQIVDRAGFAESRPSDAMAARQTGTRLHHVDQVPDGTRTETYTETVQDGTTTETYTERVQDGYDTRSVNERYACGQDCTGSERSCRQVCTNKNNGFATCRQECTGGGRTCSTRWCTRTKTERDPRWRTVTKTRQKPRYKNVTKTRDVPKFRSVERMATWFEWKEWAWLVDRTITRKGEAGEPGAPPPAELATKKALRPGESERRRDVVRRFLKVVEPDGNAREREVTAEEAARLSPQSTVTLVLHPSGHVAWRLP